MKFSESLQIGKASKGGLSYPLLCFALVLISTGCKAPQASIHLPKSYAPKAQEAPTAFVDYEEQASFPGGVKAWVKFLEQHQEYPQLAREMGIEGNVYLSFIVDEKGLLSDILVTRGIGGGCDKEAIRILENSPPWIPGKQRGLPVKSRMSLRIHFKPD